MDRWRLIDEHPASPNLKDYDGLIDTKPRSLIHGGATGRSNRHSIIACSRNKTLQFIRASETTEPSDPPQRSIGGMYAF
jgi:hypothetical protein